MGTSSNHSVQDTFTSSQFAGKGFEDDFDELNLPGAIADENALPNLAGRSVSRVLENAPSERSPILRRARSNSSNSAAKKASDTAGAVFSAIRRSPILFPERGDTRVYSEGSNELKKKTKHIRKFNEMLANGADFTGPFNPIQPPCSGPQEFISLALRRSSSASIEAHVQEARAQGASSAIPEEPKVEQWATRC